MGKEDKRRPCQTTQAENDLRWDLLEGKVSKKEYNCKWNKLLKAGEIRRGGRIIK